MRPRALTNRHLWLSAGEEGGTGGSSVGQRHRPLVLGLPWAPVSPPYTEGLAPVGDVWTHAGMWCYCRGGPARRASCPALLRMGGLSAWMLAFAEGRLAGWGRRKPSHMPPPLLSPQHIPSLLAVGPNDQHLPMQPPSPDPVPSPGWDSRGQGAWTLWTGIGAPGMPTDSQDMSDPKEQELCLGRRGDSSTGK